MRRPSPAATDRRGPNRKLLRRCLRAAPATVALILLSWPLLAGRLPISLLLSLTGLALAAAFLPATGPRGRQIHVSSGFGLASLLLLPPALTPLPLLIAGGLFAATRSTWAAQREALIESLCLIAAALAGSGVFHQAGGVFSPGAALVAGGVYGLIALGGPAAWRGTRRGDWVLDALTLAAGAPAAFLVAWLWPEMGLAALVMAGLLMALVVVVAHLGFETRLLREQARAMEDLSTVPLTQDSAARLITQFLQRGGALVSAHRMSVWLTTEADFSLQRVASLQTDWPRRGGPRTQTRHAGPAAVYFGEGLVGRVAERQLPLTARDGARESRAVESERRDWPEAPFSLLLLPLVVVGTTVGVAQFERDDAQPFTRRDMERVQALSTQAAAAIGNSRRHRDITAKAVTDGLTGLFNRRHIQSALESEQRRALRYGHPLSVIMLDIDNFKSYNDTYGHTQGDVLIKRVAALLRASVRGVDTVGRYGGEEFIILMPETTKEEAGHTAERLRRAVEAAIFPGFPDDPSMAVLKTISLGVATLPQDTGNSEAPEMLVALADGALYQAKRGGRNRVALADPHPASSLGDPLANLGGLQPAGAESGKVFPPGVNRAG